MKTIKLTAIGVLVTVTLYVGMYFHLMMPGFALDPKTFEIKYPMVCIYTESIRIPGPLSIYGASVHWLNPLYSPMDSLLRKDEIAEMNAAKAKIAALKVAENSARNNVPAEIGNEN